MKYVLSITYTPDVEDFIQKEKKTVKYLNNLYNIDYMLK